LQLSGTSVDGIDVAVCEITDTPLRDSASTNAQDFKYDVQLVCFESVPWSNEDRKIIFSLMTSKTLSAKDFCMANHLIGQRFAEAINHTLKTHNIDKNDVHVIGSHGQTVWHQVDDSTGKVQATYQIGESAVISHVTGMPTVHDFRVADVAVGGQGAPLVSIFDVLLLRHETKFRAIQNIGGIGNVTFVPPLNSTEETISFDTGPGNALIDDCVRLITNGEENMDKNGERASKGSVNEQFLKTLMSLPYFELAPPKTTGRELFGATQVKQWFETSKQLNISDNDMVSTFTQFTVDSIVQSYQKYAKKIDQVIIAGGGRYNQELMKRIEKSLHETMDASIQVIPHEQIEINSEAKEAMLFALLAYLHVHKRNGNLPSATGASKPVILGKYTPN
jgi:anhydro-N-acetylmuramic acid kinase